ncbi:kinase-like domain-containing protein [Phaeosphaeriaceae sp. PMI808]|nr:kinase-like domain-containing protein [Phaeosphaeriaceae sp. PMI808]
MALKNPDKDGAIITKLKSTVLCTQLKLSQLRPHKPSKVTKAVSKGQKKAEHKSKELVEQLSMLEGGPRPRPSSPQNPPNKTPHIPLQGPSALTAHDFEIGGTLGKGKFGHVYLARHLATDYICALKVISKAQCSTEKEEHLIRREMEVHQNLAHKNILKMLSWFHDAKSIYLVLEYAAGGSLFSRLKKQAGGRFDEHTAAQYIAQMAEALRYMHNKNIIHRDIKPENILLGLHQEIKLADFGYSVHSESGFRSTVCGTMDYVSPEMMLMMLKPRKSKEYYTKSIDQWSMGVLAYELLVGRPPFEAKNMMVTQKRIAKYKGKGIKFPKHVSEEARSLIYALLDVDAEKRMLLDDIFVHPWIVRHVEKPA